MTADESDHVIDMIAESQTVSVLDRAAWHRVLTPLALEEATREIVEVKTRQRFVNPCDLNRQPDSELGWQTAWAVVAANVAKAGFDGDHGHPIINQAASRVDWLMQTQPAEQVRWAFKAAWESLTAPAAVALEPGHVAAIGAGQ